MAKKPDPHDQTEKLLQKTIKFPIVPYSFALLLKSYLNLILEIDPARLPTRTRLRRIEASRRSDSVDPASFSPISKPVGYAAAIGKMLDLEGNRYSPSDDKHFSDDLCDGLEAAAYFFENWGHQHPSSQMTGLMQFAACKLLLAAERHIGALHYHETREGLRTGKSGITKRTGADKKKSLVLKLDDKINPSWARYTAAQTIFKNWKESDGKISVKRIADYLRESGRRPPKTPKKSKKTADM
jgi:hypothetical protein